MTKMNMNNPAGRLRYWLEERTEGESHGEALIHAWQTILGYQKGSWEGTAQVLRHAGLMADLCVEVREETMRLPEMLVPQLLLRDFGQIESSVTHFTGMTQHTLGTQLGAIEGTGQRCLELLDTYLSGHRPQGALGTATLDALIEQVEALLVEVDENTDLDADTRMFVEVRFREVRQALRDASVVGPRAVERSVEALLGSIQRQPTRWQRVGESTLANVVGGMIVALVLSLGQQPTHDMLPPGTPEQILIEHHVTVHNNVEPGGLDDTDVDIVDGEIVDADEPRGDERPTR